MQYKITFTGRQLGAIGIYEEFEEWVLNNPRIDEMAVRLELSDRYQDISNIRLNEMLIGPMIKE